MNVIYEPIGTIHSPFKEHADTPVQGIFSPESAGEIEVFPQYAEGLKDLSGFSYIILLYHFHRSQGYSLLKRPFLDDEDKGKSGKPGKPDKHGLFATRAPSRPNPIGISIVRLDKVKGNRLAVSEVDVIDGTPLLDIKPYLPYFDVRQPEKIGWYEDASNFQEYRRKKGLRPG